MKKNSILKLAEKVPPTPHQLFWSAPKGMMSIPVLFIWEYPPGIRCFFSPNSRFSTVSAPLSHVVKT